MSKFQLKRLEGWFLQIEMKCETKVTSNSTGTNSNNFVEMFPIMPSNKIA